ncbi:hypothetical protein AB3Y40_07790 [Yoonia sp. R2331]|uniref:hypothetical protein n=1 Tax=Yoonia sp. R2331 TaxID=3237238 RepID=UPI0034E4514E
MALAAHAGRSAGDYFGQKKLGLALCCLASGAVAEGRNDPFMRCTFDDDRIVVLAEQGDGFEWREGDFAAAIVPESPRTGDDPIMTFLLPNADPERIDVFLGWYGDTVVPDRVGEAMLSRTIFDDAGRLVTATTQGQCEDFFG